MTLIILPTLDGSPASVQARLEAWSSAPARRDSAELAKLRGRLGEMYDRLDLLGVQ